MKKGWMVRAGSGGFLFDDFEKEQAVAIGWPKLNDLSQYPNREAVYAAFVEVYGNDKPAKTANAVSMVWKFIRDIQPGDWIISYSQERRLYLLGEDLGQYRFSPGVIGQYPNLRQIKLLGYIQRDDLSMATRNSLGSVLTLFSLKDEIIDELSDVLAGHRKTHAPIEEENDDEEEDLLKDSVVEQSRELIKDKINRLAFDEMEVLVAAILRAMGFKTRVSPTGADRNVDVFASPDGLGLTSPRIKAEVKHRTGTTIGAKEVRSFIGALRSGDRGLFISTGGFTKDARYEAERSNVPVQLINIDDLAQLVVDHYEHFDVEGRTLIPLIQLYWPAPS